MFNTKDCIVAQGHISHDKEKWQTLVNMISELYGVSSGVVVQFRKGEFNVVSASNNEDSFLDAGFTWPWEVRSFCRQVIETEQYVYVKDAENDEEWSDAPPVSEGPVRSYLGYPVYWPDKTLFGTICAINTSSTDYSVPMEKVLGQLGKIIEGDLQHIFDYENIRQLLEENEQQKTELQKMAMYDALTGSANRNLLEERLNTMIARAERSGNGFSLLYFDLDEFKPINDKLGHKIGDFVLKTVAGRVGEQLRDTDLLARIGGDEFVIVFDNELDLKRVIQKMKKSIKETMEYEGQKLHVSASFGYSTYKTDGHNMDSLLEVADKRMYEEKTSASF